MVKTYLRYRLKHTFGIINSHCKGICFDATENFAITGALEFVNIWNLKSGTLESQLYDEGNSEVTCLVATNDRTKVAAGYSDGSIKIWSISEKKCLLVFNGHKSAITALTFNKSDTMLVSGSNDTNVIIWDILAESGICRFRGHKGPITDLCFLEQTNRVLSSSKDRLIKVWDIQNQRCIETLIGHRSEVWAIAVDSLEQYFFSGSNDQLIRIWDLTGDPNLKEISPTEILVNNGLIVADAVVDSKKKDTDDLLAIESNNNNIPSVFDFPRIRLVGAVNRQTTKQSKKNHIISLKFNHSGSVLACQTTDNIIEFFGIQTKKKALLRAKRRQNKADEKKDEKNNDEKNNNEKITPYMNISDYIGLELLLPATNKVKAINFSYNDLKVICSLANGIVEVYTLPIENEAPKRVSLIDIAGHRADVRSIILSSDDIMVASAAAEQIKIWNTNTQNCIRTIKASLIIEEEEQQQQQFATDLTVLCMLFVPGNKYLITGTKQGTIMLYDINSGELVNQAISTDNNSDNCAHSGAVWSLSAHPDKSGFISASADKSVKFWQYNIANKIETQNTIQQLEMVQIRTLQMSDDIISASFSADGAFVAVALLDNTVKTFFSDSLRFHLSFYGHSLPVMSLDISFDSQLLLTGSADKTAKIWGMKFGDCHRSLLAHEDSIMQVKFAPKTHYFFTVSKDKTIKYWDGDKFQMILKFEAHKAEVWCIAVSSTAGFFVTGSKDRSIRIWQQTDEQVFLEEEKENQLENLFESSLEQRSKRETNNLEVSKPTKETIETIKASENLIEALILAENEIKEIKIYEAEQAIKENDAKLENKIKKRVSKNALLAQFETPGDYILSVLESIRTSELDESLLLLPFAQVISLLNFIGEWVEKGIAIELSANVSIFLIKLHHNFILTNPKPILLALQSLQKNLRPQLEKIKNLTGKNIAAMKYQKKKLEVKNLIE
eukprot:TRINITY_DN228_c1_g1_i1.p1 TRINITY_DN228_c1_g1~~TRINITY_DN228_c1_g1_i1.p1  ORF type:complete len:952 (+),score=435.85 TRINITY_DN228_c1_g1_i1:48-2903(+)